MDYDAIVIGSGPNGLAAAIKLAQEGLSVAIFEAKKTIGGGMRTAEITLPGYLHDICSAIHPLGVSSPFFRTLSLEKFGLEWIHPPICLAHPFDDGSALLLDRSLQETADCLAEDGNTYRKIMTPLLENWSDLEKELLAPLHFPRKIWPLIRFSWLAMQSASHFSKRKFKTQKAHAFFGGLAGHAILPLEAHLTTAYGLILALLGHHAGWPLAKGGSQKIADALSALFSSLGGTIFTENPVDDLGKLPPSKIILCDLTPKQVFSIVGNRLPKYYQSALKKFRYGPGVFKIDWALSSPIPWSSALCKKAGTVHIGGTIQEISESERSCWEQKHSKKPFIILVQPSLFDDVRAPSGKHTAWGYCHVPSGSTVDMTDEIELQVERFAPGFRDIILARSTKNAAAMEAYNSNYIGGDINGGVQDIRQLFSRPAGFLNPYATPLKGLYICSSSTPPGGGVHGMCGYHAALAALKVRI